jgi:hypothetical protein
MTPEQLMRRLSSLQKAADNIDAIDDPHLQRRQGLDLTNWRYRLVHWGSSSVTRRHRNSVNATSLSARTGWTERG